MQAVLKKYKIRLLVKLVPKVSLKETLCSDVIDGSHFGAVYQSFTAFTSHIYEHKYLSL